jgi:hypothetical protein
MQPTGSPSVIDAFIYGAQILRLIDNIPWVGNLVEHIGVADLNIMLEIDEKLDEVTQQLPGHLQYVSDAGRDFDESGTILRLQGETILMR